MQKTAIVEKALAEKKRGVRGKIVAKKTSEMKEELESAVALVQQYLPLEHDKMQAMTSAGTASLAQAGSGFAALKFPGYAKTNNRAHLDVRVGSQDHAPARSQHLAGQAGRAGHPDGGDECLARRDE